MISVLWKELELVSHPFSDTPSSMSIGCRPEAGDRVCGKEGVVALSQLQGHKGFLLRIQWKSSHQSVAGKSSPRSHAESPDPMRTISLLKLKWPLGGFFPIFRQTQETELLVILMFYIDMYIDIDIDIYIYSYIPHQSISISSTLPSAATKSFRTMAFFKMEAGLADQGEEITVISPQKIRCVPQKNGEIHGNLGSRRSQPGQINWHKHRLGDQDLRKPQLSQKFTPGLTEFH